MQTDKQAMVFDDSDRTRLTITLYLVVVLLVCQVAVVMALFILIKAFRVLKKNVEENKNSLSLQLDQIESLENPASRVEPARLGSHVRERANSQESITNVPSPTLKRKDEIQKRTSSLSNRTVSFTRNPSTHELLQGSTFTSFITSRDSGIDFIATDRERSLSQVLDEREATSTKGATTRTTSRGSQGEWNTKSPDVSRVPQFEPERASSTSSRVSIKEATTRTSSRGSYGSSRTILPDELVNENESQGNRSSRSCTMAIEMLDFEDSPAQDEKKYKRASKILNQLTDYEDSTIGFQNDGFHGDPFPQDTSVQHSPAPMKRAPLASLDSESSLNTAHDLDINDNNSEDVYMNQDAIEEAMCSTRNTTQDEYLNMNSAEYPTSDTFVSII